MAVWFTADTHFGHAGALSLYRRPFASVAEMNAAMLERVERDRAAPRRCLALGRLRAAHQCRRGRRPAAGAERTQAFGDRQQRSARRSSALPEWSSVQPYVEITVDGTPTCAVPLRVPDLERHGKGRAEPARPQPRAAEAAAAAA